ncbi:chemotaxis response regulator protein-glutamate methylesterase [Roseomonas sp. AR75]|uniref:protein-glutamate methylesterase/protein-glutamine glutaminase n=1 Tax=Roseomonas sp. AR75 TaxID=2562311 RepID=UPI0010C042EC|nr:chemotaxis response regulator protein-glutamate methylesterase [Roseomonas sp. AR75]
MLCDDSAVARGALSRMLARDPAIRVTAQAANGRQAVEMLAALPAADRPQVILLDLEMPVMDGLTALPLILRAAPGSAVIVASALTQRGAAATMQALRAGAVDYVPKPAAAQGGMNDPAFGEELRAKVTGWARMRRREAPRAMRPVTPAAAALPKPQAIALGSSTGGPQALATLVGAVTRPPPVPVLAVQHMPAGFTTLLADHLDRLGRLPCAEARDGEALLPGRLYLAPGDRHLIAKPGPNGLVAQLSDAPAENFCRPAVDPLLRSLVACCGGKVIAAILTGMGQDGLAGCRALRAAGGGVLAQDEASSVVWGMPGAVTRAGLAAVVAPPEEIAARLLAACGEGRA